MRHISQQILVAFLFVLSAVCADGRDSLSVREAYHDFTAAVSSGYDLPSHGYYRGYNPSGRPIYANTSLHLEYAFAFGPQTRLGALYPGVRQGIGVSCLSFYDHELMGTPVSAYIFQNGRIAEFKPGFGLEYRWDLGVSYGWRINEMVGTRANIYVNVGLMLSWELSPIWSLGVGPEFSHFSNGDTRYPNGGANLLNIRASVTGNLHPKPSFQDKSAIREYDSQLRQKTFARRMSYDLIACGGWRAGKVTDGDYAVINRHFPCVAICFMPMYRIHRYFSAGVSLDLIADRSANIGDVVKDPDTHEVVGYELPPFSRQMAAGLSARGDVSVSMFTIGAGFGGFVLGQGNSLKGLYTMFSLKAFLSRNLFLNVTYRLSSRNYTHNLMYGVGWRFGAR